MDLNKLSALAKAQQKTNSKQVFKKVAVFLGAEVKEHYPKKKDAEGKTLKDDNGNDLREEVSDGFIYTLNEVGTSKVLKVVYPKKIELNMMSAYVIGGLGYNITSGNLIYIDENSTISNYQ